jgi:hypothetical protein
MNKIVIVTLASILLSCTVIQLASITYAYGLTASEFVAKYGDQFSHGEQITVLVKVKGEPQSSDPAKRAKEIRYYQGGILKFIHFAGATNVISDTVKNQFTAIMTTTLAEHIATRYDVLSVSVIDTNEKIGKNRCSIIGPGANLSGCDLYGVLFKKDLRGVNFANANLRGADLQGADLSGADMRLANLKSALLNEANLTNANLAFAKLIRAEITNADLTNVNFYRATLYHSDFTNSDLTNVDFRYSILTYAILANTNLKGANFENSGTWATNLNHCYNHKICE